MYLKILEQCFVFNLGINIFLIQILELHDKLRKMILSLLLFLLVVKILTDFFFWFRLQGMITCWLLKKTQLFLFFYVKKTRLNDEDLTVYISSNSPLPSLWSPKMSYQEPYPPPPGLLHLSFNPLLPSCRKLSSLFRQDYPNILPFTF